MLEKISAEQVDGLMIKAASALRGQKAEIENLKAEISRRDRRDHAEKIAHLATDRGIMDSDDASEYAEKLASGNENLSQIEDFISRTAAGITLGKTHEKVASETEGDAFGQDVLTSFLLTSDLAG